MKKEVRNRAFIIILIAGAVAAILLIYTVGPRQAPPEEAVPAAVEEAVAPVEGPPERAEKARAVVEQLFATQAIPETVELSPLEFEKTVSVVEPGADTNEVEAATGVRVSAEQVLAVVNGVPLTGAKLMPPGRFKKGGSVVLSPDVLAEVLERSINRELILQEAAGQGIALGDLDMRRLADTYVHLTGNPLNMKGGGEVADLNVRGTAEEDALFYALDKAARLLQLQLLKQAGQADTAENRLAFSEELWSSATIEVVDTRPPENVTKDAR